MKIPLLLGILLSFSAYGQVNWTYFPNDPVLSMDTASSMWGAYGQPTVIIHNDTLKMWYAVAEGEDQFDTIPRGRIHYAWSLDGVSWTKHSNNPVLDVSGNGQWDGQWLDTPEILWDGIEFKMYYYGDSTYFQGQSNTAIGLATSPDGINWTRQAKVLEKGNLGEWDGKFIESPALYYDFKSGLYAMLYTGADTVGFAQIGLALSMDGYNFIKYLDYPVISVGNYPSWNDIASATPSLIETDGIIEMWYCGISHDNGQYDSARVGYAVTLNGINWIQFPANPILTDTKNKNSSFWAIDVVFDSTNNVYKMYYEDFWLNDANAIFYATAPRDVLFSKNCNVGIINDTVIAPDSTVSLWATGGNRYTWDPVDNLSDPNIPNPIATPDTTTTYTVLIVNSSCITKAEVKVTVDPNLHITNNLWAEELSVYPNPFFNSATITSNETFVDATFTVYNPLGKTVIYQNKIYGNEILIEKGNLSKGLYFFQIKNKDHIKSGRFIIE